MKYILRIAVHEDSWKRQLSEIVEVCHNTPIGEIMLMEQSHKILTSPFPEEKHLRMVEIYRRMAETFRQEGVEFSINYITTVGHTDNPVPDRLKLPYTRFVGETLQPSDAIYCISDENWVDYTCRIAAHYASLKPDRLMIDDDFRSLNHTAQYGCFCQNHVAMTARELGRELTQRQLYDAVRGIGEDAQEIKTAWMKVNFACQLRAAKAIEKAVHEVSPNTQVGLMNSGEQAHSIQGRDMNQLLRAFAGSRGHCLSRPLGGAYSDTLHHGICAIVSGMSLSMAAVQEDTDWVSEVENYPNSLYNKSTTLTKLQMQLHALAGVDALSLNLYDYLATPLPLQGEYAQLVKDADTSVQKIENLRKGKKMCGVGLPWHKEAARYLQNRSHSPEGLVPPRPFDNILPLLGIPVQFTPARTNFLYGDDVLCYTRQELEHFLAGGLILDGVAAEHLMSLGYGDLLGCHVQGSVDGPCVEKVTSHKYGQKWNETLMCTDWGGCAYRGQKIARLVPHLGAEEIACLLDDEKQYLAPSITTFHNASGGTVCVMAVPPTEIGWLCTGRAVLMQNLLADLPGGDQLAIVRGSTNLASFCYEGQEGSRLLAVVNCGLDPAKAVLPEGYMPVEAESDPVVIDPVRIKCYIRADGIQCRR